MKDKNKNKNKNKDLSYLYWFHEESPMFEDKDENPDLEFLHEIDERDFPLYEIRLIQRK